MVETDFVVISFHLEVRSLAYSGVSRTSRIVGGVTPEVYWYDVVLADRRTHKTVSFGSKETAVYKEEL